MDRGGVISALIHFNQSFEIDAVLNRFVNSYIRCALPNRFIKMHKLLYEPCFDLYLAYCEFNQQYFDMNLFDELSILLPTQLQSYSTVRQSEFLAGRYAAKLALAAMPEKLCLEQVIIGGRKEPIFPKDLIGTLTHSDTMAMCAVTSSKALCFVGIDIEPIMTKMDFSGIEGKVYSARELQLLTAKGINKEIAATLIFSAKESIFKAFSKQIHHGIDFHRFELSELIYLGHSLSMKFDVREVNFEAQIMVSAKIHKKHVLTLVAQ
ncbi:MAG: 4'-phosphopantetheinyl transferase superfamily protein [Acinetobacter sp.]